MSDSNVDNKFELLSIFDVLKMSNAAGADFSSEKLERYGLHGWRRVL